MANTHRTSTDLLLEPSHASTLNCSEHRLPRAKLRGEVSFWLFLSRSVVPTTAMLVPQNPVLTRVQKREWHRSSRHFPRVGWGGAKEESISFRASELIAWRSESSRGHHCPQTGKSNCQEMRGKQTPGEKHMGNKSALHGSWQPSTPTSGPSQGLAAFPTWAPRGTAAFV